MSSRCLALLTSCTILAVTGWSAELAGLLRGRVADAQNAPIADAIVTATSETGSLQVTVKTGVSGEFVTAVAPGHYQVRVFAEGFQPETRGIEAVNGVPAVIDLTLQLAPRSEMVTVTESISNQVMTSASLRTPVPLLNTPQSITVVSQDLIRDQSMQNMADVVRYVPGITMAQGEGHRDAPVIRGNATTADFYVNGVRDDVQYYRDLYNVERVEAVKGANALTFGRGGGGGVINRVTKEAGFSPIREVSLQGGSYGNKRAALDFGQNVNDRLAFRVNGMYENSDSYRRGAGVERYGVAPGLTYLAGSNTRLKAGYEYFNDNRTVDRGIPSFQGRPSPADRRTFFGDPDASYAYAHVNLGSFVAEHQAGRLNLRNSTMVGDYDKFYQNILPGAVSANLSQVSLSGYSNFTHRRNLFNQTDANTVFYTGRFRHTLLVGAELGRQSTFNFRQTAYFGNATAMNVPFAAPTVNAGANFRQSASDADNTATNHIAATYFQDQIEINRWVQVVAGVRYDRFNMDFFNNRNREELGRRDNMVSPRAGLVLKPIASVSLYSSYSVAYLPSSGDQFSSLTATTQTLRPEKFSNYELGAKWDLSRSFAFTTAAYRLDRTNTTARDPNDPARVVQTGSQRTKGYELGLNGSIRRNWRVVGGYAYQDAYVSSPTTAALQGAKIALVPHHTFSLWNNYQLLPRLGLGLGVVRQADLFTGVDNTVKLPAFTRVDAAVFFRLTENVRLQGNVENLADTTYYPTAHSNNNIMPGSPRAARLGLIAQF